MGFASFDPKDGLFKLGKLRQVLRGGPIGEILLVFKLGALTDRDRPGPPAGGALPVFGEALVFALTEDARELTGDTSGLDEGALFAEGCLACVFGVFGPFFRDGIIFQPDLASGIGLQAC